jgi:hypothetical protein
MDFLTKVLAPSSNDKKRKADAILAPLPPVTEYTNKKTKKTPVVKSGPSLNEAAEIIDGLNDKMSNQQSTVVLPNILHAPEVDMSTVDKVKNIVHRMITEKVDDLEMTKSTRQLIAADLLHTMGPDSDNRIPLHARVMDTNRTIHHVVMELMRRYDEKEQEKLKKDEAAADVITRISLSTCTRAHEETQLREPRENERQCVAGVNCECFKEPKFNFIMKEFLTQDEEIESIKNNITKNEHGYCLYCIREICTYSFIMSAVLKLKMTGKFACQSHIILVNIPGEYMIEDCFFTGVTSPYAQILNTPNIYTLHNSHHGKVLRQSGLGTIAADVNPHAVAASQGFRRGVLQ